VVSAPDRGYRLTDQESRPGGRISNVRARAILAAHGIDPDAGADALGLEIETRGWRVEVERNSTGGRGGGPVRWRALATRAARAGQAFAAGLTASGRSAEAVLAVVLAKVLEREG